MFLKAKVKAVLAVYQNNEKKEVPLGQAFHGVPSNQLPIVISILEKQPNVRLGIKKIDGCIRRTVIFNGD